MNASPGNRPPASSRRGLLDRLLSLFADVRGGEGAPALLMMLNVFLLLSCYYIIKPVREAFILSGSGAEVKSYASAAMVVVLVFLIPAYSAFASRVNRTTLLTWVTGFFVVNLIAFYFLAQARMPYLDIVFFVWVGIFNVMIIAQFWSLANDVYTPDEGKRLFAIIAFGSTIGAIVGATLVENLVDPEKADPNAVNRMLLVAAGVLAVCGALTLLISRRSKVAVSEEAKTSAAEQPLASKGAFRLVLSERYLLLIGLLMLIVNFVNTTGEYILGETLERTAKSLAAAGQTAGLAAEEFEKQFIGNYYAGFFKWVNWVTALVQLFIVSRFLKWFGVRAALFVLPLIALGGYAMLALAPVLSVIRGVKIAENSVDYSLQNTTRQALFLPTSREAKYKAKQATDTFFWRAGDVLSAALVFVGSQLALPPRGFALVNIVLVLAWIVIVIGLARLHKQRTADSEAVPATAPARA
ncbi:MAG TPA: Npt1/Npt2 family nucleotide transporter [Candidatus Limnocylindria bacterium]|nr:Npt1/Npt2 family nucleotide transporter [Candidatus Limnocylindria bacterium]